MGERLDINKVLNPSKDILETSGESRGLETGAVAVAVAVATRGGPWGPWHPPPKY